jgi:hypothetical protein
MKKFFILIPALLLLFMASCDSNNGQPLIDYDMVYLQGGKLAFYKDQPQETRIYKSEHDSVVNAVYSLDSILYYTVSHHGDLILKSLDLKDPKAKPVKVINWDLKLSDCDNYMDGNLGAMCFNKAQDQLAMNSVMAYSYHQYCNLNIYDFQSKTLKKGALYQYMPDTDELYLTDEKIDFRPYKEYNVANTFETTIFGDLYFKMDSTKISLTDQLDYRKMMWLEPELPTEYVDINVISTNPDRTKVLFTAMMPWDDYNYSCYCVSTMDGKTQTSLDSELTKTEPRWLHDGSLVFVSQQRDNEGKKVVDKNNKPVYDLKVMAPDGTIKVIGNACDFVVK